MAKIKKYKSRFEMKNENVDCPYFGNIDNAPMTYCYLNPCESKIKKFCHVRTNEKLRSLLGTTKSIDQFK